MRVPRLIKRLDEKWSLSVFEFSLWPLFEIFLSLPACWFGLPVFVIVGPLWLAMMTEGQNSGYVPYDIYLSALFLTILLGMAWWSFLKGNIDMMTKVLFSNIAFAISPFIGVGVCYRLAPSETAFSIGVHHILLYSSSLIPVMLLKHRFRRFRPCLTNPNLINNRYIQILPKLQTKLGPDASFPSGDAAAVVAFALPLATGRPFLAFLLVILTCVGRVFFLVHYVADTVAGAISTYFCQWLLRKVGCDVGDAQWWHPILAHLSFIAFGVLRRSNHK